MERFLNGIGIFSIGLVGFVILLVLGAIIMTIYSNWKQKREKTSGNGSFMEMSSRKY